jgi:hypothetical protein
VVFDATEFDARLGTPGLHRVDRAVSMPERATILPPDLFKRVASDSFWTDLAASSTGGGGVGPPAQSRMRQPLCKRPEERQP